MVSQSLQRSTLRVVVWSALLAVGLTACGDTLPIKTRNMTVARDEFFRHGLEENPASLTVEPSQSLMQSYSTAPALMYTLQEHSNVIMQLAMNASGTILVSGAADGKVHIWNLESGKVLSSYSHDGLVYSVAIGPDDLVMSGGVDKTVKLWDLKSNKLYGTLHTPDAVGAVAIDPQGNYLAAGVNYADQIYVWDLKSLKLIVSISERFFEFSLLAFNSTGNSLHARFGLGENRVWDIPSGELLRAFPDSHYGEWSYSAIDQKGRLLATSSEAESEVYVWDTLSGQRLKSIEVMFDGGPFDSNIALSRDGSILVSAALDGKVRLWKTSDGTLLSEFDSNHEDEIHALALSDKYLITGDHSGIIKVWKFR